MCVCEKTDAVDKFGRTALIWAAKKGKLDICKQLVLEKGADINTKDCDGNTALMFAIWIGAFELVTLLVKAGADVNAKDNDGRTALMFATARRSGNSYILEKLIEHGADVNAKDNENRTALMFAAT